MSSTLFHLCFFLLWFYLSSINNVLFSNRYGRWHKDKADQTRNVSRVIVFILGGTTFSEVRSAYEVSKDKSSSWEVIVGRLQKIFLIIMIFLFKMLGGDTQVLTPEGFLQNVGNLELVQ